MSALGSAVGEARHIWKHPARDRRAIARFVAWQFHCLLGRPGVAPFTRYGARFYCPPERRGTAKLVFTFRERYETELASLGDLVSEGDSVVDVGAHYGAYTIVLARLVGAQGHVVAIEPSAAAVAVLRRNVELNDLRNVTVIQAGAAELAGVGRLKVSADPSRTTVIEAEETNEGGALPSVDLVRVDDVAATRPVSFMKIDVEGAEGLVLAGAASVLHEDRPIVQFEHNPSAEESPGHEVDPAWALMSGLGYRMFTTERDGTRRQVPTPPPGLVNLVALP